MKGFENQGEIKSKQNGYLAMAGGKLHNYLVATLANKKPF